MTCCYVIELWHNSSIDKCDEIFNLLKLINYNEKQTGKNISCYCKFNIVQYFNRNNDCVHYSYVSIWFSLLSNSVRGNVTLFFRQFNYKVTFTHQKLQLPPCSLCNSLPLLSLSEKAYQFRLLIKLITLLIIPTAFITYMVK